VNIGLIGLGVISQYAHIPAYKYKDLNLIGVADLDKNAVEKTKEKWGIPIATQDPDEIINNPNIDIIDIATPPQTHAQFVRKAAKAGKHILCQKPLALTIEGAKNLVQIAKENNVKLAVNQNMRWSPQSVWVKKSLSEKKIGDPFFILINYGRYEEYSEWRANIKGLIFWELTIHYLDLLRHWFGEPISVYAQKTYNPDCGAVDTVDAIILKFPNGLIASMTNNWASVDKNSKTYNIRIDGSKGTLNISKGEVQLYSTEFLTPGWFRPKLAAKFNYEGPYPLCLDAFAYSMENLLEAIEEDKEPIVSGQDNLKTIKLVHAAYSSAEKNTVIYLE